jgi:DNA-binding transcriptional LysR family regulator
MGGICYDLIQMNEPLETSELLAFTRTVDARSLSRAAAELGVPRATISRRLARLEERLGVRLLRRTTRSLALTDAGDAFYRQARIALEAVGQAEQSVRRTDAAIRGPLRVSMPPMLDPSLLATLCDFAKKYPEVQLHASFSTRLVDLQRDGYDVALRATSHLAPGLVARTLARTPLVAVASPAYLAEKGTPRSARDLKNHRCLLGFARGELPDTHWPLANGGRVQVSGALFSNDLPLLCEAALRGLGIAVTPTLLVDRLLRSGELVHVLPGVIAAEARIALVYPEREFVPPQVRAFIDAMMVWAASALREVPPAPAARAAAPKAASKPRAASKSRSW